VSTKWAWTTTATLPSRKGAHLPLLDEILARLTGLGWDGRDYFGIQMALEESLTNAIRHGNKLDESKSVQVECKASEDAFWIRVEDEGEGFQPNEVADCTDDEHLDCTGGRGMLLIKTYMTRVEHNQRGNRITLEKTRSRDTTV
jgi:serine/threonine-protein kinase RsbW